MMVSGAIKGARVRPEVRLEEVPSSLNIISPEVERQLYLLWSLSNEEQM